MISLLILLFVLVAIMILGLMLRDASKGLVPLISIKNIFLVGFILFQVTSPISTLVAGNSNDFHIAFIEQTGFKMLFWVLLFYGTFYIAYPRLPLANVMTRMVPITRLHPGTSMLVSMSVMLTILAIVFHFGVMVPLVSVLANFLAISFSAIACGMIGWVWAPRLLNPLFGLMAAPIIGLNLANVLTGTFGRRSLLALLACFLWGMFYSRWRHLNPVRMVVTMVVIGIFPVMLLALFTSARESSEHDRSAGQQLQAMIQQGSLKDGFLMLADGQEAGGVSMWCIEKYPETYPTKFAFTARYGFMLPIPRAIWPDKPMPLSRDLPTLAQIQGVARNKLSIGPGIIGHAAADGGLVMVVIYAIMIAYICRILDGLVHENIFNPIIVLPIGSALSNTIGLARGETGVFVFIMMFSIVTSYFILVVSAKCIDYLGLAKREEPDDWWEEDYDSDEYESAY